MNNITKNIVCVDFSTIFKEMHAKITKVLVWCQFFSCSNEKKTSYTTPLNLESFLYSVIQTEYVRMDPGCLSVSVCVCLSVTALKPKRLGRFRSNFTQMVSRTQASVVFIRFWISQFYDVLAAILHFSYAALSRP